MNKLISYKIIGIDTKNKVLVVDVEFSNKDWNKRKRMQYETLSFTPTPEGEAEMKALMGDAYKPSEPIAPEEYIKFLVETWAGQFIQGKEAEKSQKKQEDVNEVKKVVNKKIVL